MKRSNHSLQSEIARFLFSEYESFLQASESLEQFTFQVEDAKTTLAHQGMVLSSIRG